MRQALYRGVETVALVLLCGSAPVLAQSLSAPVPANNSSPNELNLSDLGTSWDRQSQITTLSNSGTAFELRYASSVSCDSGAFGSARTETLSSDYTISFSVTAPAAYYIDVDTRRTGDLGARYDGGITGGNATLGAVSGVQTGGSFVSGSLNLADPSDCNIGGGTTSSCNQPFNQLSTARYSGVSNGAPVNHTLHFTWTQSTFSAAASGHEGAVRMGLQSRDATNEASRYPGSPSRAAQSNDGHFVKVTLVSLCGNGAIDSGEQCDQGAANGTPGSCCTASCGLRAAGLFCRLPMDACDAAELCDGVNPICPPDAYSPGSQVCRPGAGDCDPAELCSGFGPACPPDEIAAPTVVCRAASPGEVCDVSEFCDGVNVDCPADAVEPSGTLCRGAAGVCDVVDVCDGSGKLCPGDAKSTGPCRAAAGACDTAESCDGVGNDCPADAFQPASVTCRAAAGVCDLAEHCTGSGAACPADAKSSAVCRAAAGACDAAESCDGIADACPGDQLVSSGTTCRAAAGSCDVAETCTGGSPDCPANAFQSSGSACGDGAFCNGEETCDGAGACADGADPCPFICSEGLDQCLMSGCPNGPIAGCRTAQKSLLLLKNKLDDGRDKLIWKWIKGQPTTLAELQDPLDTANYALCVFDGPGAALRLQMDIPPSGALWSPLGSGGYRYYDFTAAEDGAQRVLLKGSTGAKSKALVRGAGGALEDPLDDSALALPVRVQLINHETGKCFESTFNSFKRSTTEQFKAKH
jgi:hypothetical protein